MINKKSISNKKSEIAVIGLGYVGLPLAIEFSKKYKVIGFDIKQKRIQELSDSFDVTSEVSTRKLKLAKYLKYTDNVNEIKDCTIYIIAIPTPINSQNKPNLKPLKNASKLIGKVLKKNDIVIYESTVFPGATEEICVPILERNSGLKYNKEFFCGYSPERINPGDKKHKITSIKKVTSGSNKQTAIKVDKLYRNIITAGTHLAPSIKVAEAAKIIENTQRDVNIALINEFTKIFNKLKIDTNSVLEAAETKWNFLSFKPGLVGGHCIGVDPYYLAHKAKQIGLNPKMIISGRETNDSMSSFVVKRVIEAMSKKSIRSKNANILIMGLTFKENCPDIRNTKIIDLIRGFENLHMKVDVYDPLANKDEVFEEYKLRLIDHPIRNKYDTILIAVNHNKFRQMQFNNLLKFCKKKNVIYDLKNTFPESHAVIKL